MASIVSKKQQSAPLDTRKNTEDEEEEEIQNNPSSVTSHLYLKPAHSNETLDREVVLRRFRHRKRVHNVKKAVQALFSSPFASKSDKAVSAPRMKWVDDAFAAL